jgi:hypothetical protein
LKARSGLAVCNAHVPFAAPVRKFGKNRPTMAVMARRPMAIQAFCLLWSALVSDDGITFQLRLPGAMVAITHALTIWARLSARDLVSAPKESGISGNLRLADGLK